MRLTLTLWTLVGVLACASGAGATDDVSEDLMLRFNELALRAEKVNERDGPQAAIRIYERAILEDGEFGRINLRPAQLYQELGRMDEAAFHFKACDADQRVDALDRELICQTGFSTVTAPLQIDGLPRDGQIIVVAPERFAGPYTTGDALPRGLVRLVVEAPGREPRESEVEIGKTARWTAALGERRPLGGPATDPQPDPVPIDTPVGVGDTIEPPKSGPTRWPSYVTGVLGAALVGGGVYLGLDNRGTLDEIRDRQASGDCGVSFCEDDLVDADNRARLADGLWIGGAALMATSAVLWFVLDGDDPPVEASE